MTARARCTATLLRGAATLALACTLTGAMQAQSRTLVVKDSLGQPVAFATVVVKGGQPRVTNASGTVDLSTVGTSADISVRRIGYREYFGKASFEGPDGVFEVRLNPVAQLLGKVTVNAKPENLPLAGRGFYERMMDAHKGRYNGEYYTPEMLESKAAGKVTQLLNNSKHVRVDVVGGLPVLRGRANCAMSIIIDGQLMKGIYEGPPPAPRIGRAENVRGDKLTVDDLIGTGEISAIEIYPHGGNAPANFQVFLNRGSCGVVAIWTGGR